MIPSRRTAPAVVLRSVTASTDARYVPSDLACPHLVERDEAMRFRTEAAAARFLRENPDFKGFRTEKA